MQLCCPRKCEGRVPSREKKRKFVLDMMQKQGLESVMDRQIPFLLGDPGIDLMDPLALSVKAMALEVGEAAFARQAEAIWNREDTRDVLADLTCPTLILVGEKDSVTPEAASLEMDLIRRGKDEEGHYCENDEVEFHVVPDAAHMLTMQAPDLTSELLFKFFLKYKER